MNARTFDLTSPLLVYGLPIFIILAAASLAFTPLISAHPEIAIGITYDLTLSAPLVYLFLIRKTKLPKITVVPFFVLGIIIASFILPAEQQFHLDIVKIWILPAVEMLVLGFVGFSAYKTFKTYKTLKKENTDVFSILKETCQKVMDFQILANVFAFEMAVFYYSFLGWKKLEKKENTFTYHKKSGRIALFGAIILIIGVETAVLHFIVSLWSPIIAWLLTIFSLYFLLQIFAHIKAMLQRPIEIASGKLLIRYGLFGDAIVDIENIESIEFVSTVSENGKSVKQLSLLRGLEQFNTKIQLKNEAVLEGFYGMKSKFKMLLFFVDDTDRFKEKLNLNDHN